MTDEVVISVRGEASTTVMPDEARLICAVRAAEASKADAMRTVSAALDACRADLASLGGTARDLEQTRSPLSWVAYSATTTDEYEHDDRKGRSRTGRVIATVDLRLFVRDFVLLTQIGDLFVEQEFVVLHHVNWTVDVDNPEWARVRADAIGVGVQRAGDYAAALSGSIVRIDQVADAGLLADGSYENGRTIAFAASGGGHREFPTLDPEVQELRAAVDVRAIASVPEV